MPLIETINRASAVVGSQNKLAEIVGASSGSLSDMKAGRKHCPLTMRARIAHIAGIDPKLEMIEALTEELGDTDPFELELKQGLSAILHAFSKSGDPPLEIDEDQNKE